ncbi:MAG: hypothetical protein ACPG6F_03810, partial [Flavobacteriaceae bacterium]
MNEPIKNRTEVENPLSFLTIKERIAALLYTYLQQSKKGDSKVLNQEHPERIAEELQLKNLFQNGFQNIQ